MVINKVVSRVDWAGTDSGLHPLAAYFISGTGVLMIEDSWQRTINVGGKN